MPDPRVLIVEDDHAIRALMVAALRREPLTVDTAADGLDALENVRRRDYAVILLDLMMPRVNGFEFLEQLELVRPKANPVIIVMTAFDTAALKRLRAVRVQAVLHKPFDVEQVVEMVRDCAVIHQQHVSGVTNPELPYVPDERDSSDEAVC